MTYTCCNISCPEQLYVFTVPLLADVKQILKEERSRRDSNPRYLSAQRFSRPSRSTTLPLLRIKSLSEICYGRVKNRLSNRILKLFYNQKRILQTNSAVRLAVFGSKKNPLGLVKCFENPLYTGKLFGCIKAKVFLTCRMRK